MVASGSSRMSIAVTGFCSVAFTRVEPPSIAATNRPTPSATRTLINPPQCAACQRGGRRRGLSANSARRELARLRTVVRLGHQVDAPCGRRYRAELPRTTLNRHSERLVPGRRMQRPLLGDGPTEETDPKPTSNAVALAGAAY